MRSSNACPWTSTDIHLRKSHAVRIPRASTLVRRGPPVWLPIWLPGAPVRRASAERLEAQKLFVATAPHHSRIGEILVVAPRAVLTRNLEMVPHLLPTTRRVIPGEPLQGAAETMEQDYPRIDQAPLHLVDIGPLTGGIAPLPPRVIPQPVAKHPVPR